MNVKHLKSSSPTIGLMKVIHGCQTKVKTLMLLAANLVKKK